MIDIILVYLYRADKNTLSRHMAQYAKTSVGAVILSPTRELATQIATEAIRLMHHLKEWDVRLFIGGANKGRQLLDFKRGRRDIVVATPGRLLDVLSEPVTRDSISKAKFLVFDEADTLLDMGFTDQIRSIVDLLPPKEERQTFMFSATVSREIRQIAKATLRPKHTFIDTVPESEANAHVHIPQYFTVLKSAKDYIPHIFRLLAQDALLHPEGGKAILFFPTTRMTELFAIIIKAMSPSLPCGLRGTKVFEMHAKKTQVARDRTSSNFRNAKGEGYSILVTTDISARGVDYPGVTRVIQAGIPSNKDGYVHRLGRTGRAGKDGRGDLILLPWETDWMHYQLQSMPLKQLSTSDLEHDLEKLATECDDKASQGGRSTFSSERSPAPALPRIQDFPSKLQDGILPDIGPAEVQDVFASQLGFYAGHSQDIRVSKSQILSGLTDWAVGAFGLSEPPSLSPTFLTKIGFGGSSGSRYGNSFGGPGRRSDSSFGGSDRRSDSSFGRPNRRSDSFESGQYDRLPQSGRRQSFSPDRAGFGSRGQSYNDRGPSFGARGSFRSGSDSNDAYRPKRDFGGRGRESFKPGFRSRGSRSYDDGGDLPF